MDSQKTGGSMWAQRPASHTRRLHGRLQTSQVSLLLNSKPSETMRTVNNQQNLNKRNSWHHSNREDGQENLDIYELTRPHADLRRLRSCRSVVAWKKGTSDGLAGSYYTPMLSSRPRRSRSLTLSMANTEESSIYGVKSEGQLHTRKIKPAHPWSTFCGHLEMITAGGYTDSSGKQVFSMKASEAYNKVIKDMKDKSLKRKTAAIIMASRLRKPTESMKHESDSDSEDEYEKDRAAKRKAAAQRYWGIIRRDVTEKIRQRKERNGASKSWNILRQQVRTKTRAENVRLELYIKYGIIKPTDARINGIQPIGRPRLSDSARCLINEFSNMELNRIESPT